MAEELGSLAVKIGLDSSGFQNGISSINRNLRVLDSEFKANTAALGENAKGIEGLKLKEESLSKQMELQKQKVSALEQAYTKSSQTKGKDSKATQELEIKLNKAKQALSNMETELGKTTKEMEKESAATNKLGSGIQASMTKMHTHVSGAFNGIKSAAIGVGTTLAGGLGLFALTEKAVESGDATYKLSQKLGVTASEAGNLNKMLKITDTDTQPFISTMLRLDKGIESAGRNGNATTKSLEEFGVKLTDANGKLLPMPEQLKKLSEGYQKAAASGNEEAFVAQVLGAKGQELIPILQDYTEASEAASKVKGFGVDPKEAHEQAIQMKVLKMEMSQFSMVMAQVLLPIASAVLPVISNLFTSLGKVISDNKKTIQDAVNSIASVIKTMGAVITPIIKNLFDFIAKHGELTKAIIIGIVAVLGELKIAKFVTDIITGVSNIKKAVEGLQGLSKIGGIFEAIFKINPLAFGILVGITAIAAAAYLIIKNWEPIKKFFSDLWNGIKTTFNNFWNWLKEFFSKWGTEILVVIAPFIGIPLEIVKHWDVIKVELGATWNWIKTTVTSTFTSIGTFFTNIWTNISNTFSNVLTAITTFIRSKFGSMSTGINNIFNGLKSYFTGIWEVIKNIFLGAVLLILDVVTGNFKKLSSDAQGIWNNLKNAFSEIWKGIQQIFTGALQAISAFCSSIWKAISSTAKTIWNDFKNYIENLWNSIKQSGENAWTKLKETVIYLCTNIKEGAINIWNALLNWFAELPEKLYSYGSSMFERMREGVESTIGNVRSSIENGISNALNYLASLPGIAWSYGADFVNGIVNGIWSAVGSVEDAVSALAAKIRSYLHFSVPDEGPLTDYEKWMPDFMAGLAEGINKSKHIVAEAVNGLSLDMKVNSNIAEMAVPHNNSLKESENIGNRNGLTLHIENFNNYTEKDIEQLAYELEFYRQKISMGKGGV